MERFVETPDAQEGIYRENVHPSSWNNPVPAGRYNLVVLGAGTAGLVAAAGASALGAKVALVEQDRMGGDCLNTGCVPSKGLIRSARAVYDMRKAGSLGIFAERISVDFAAVVDRVRGVQAALSRHDSVARFSRELGIEVFLGKGAFVGRDRIAVNGAILSFRKAAICTGARPGIPPIPGLDQARFATSETVFQQDRLPARLLVIGAGPIGCELAQTFARLGSAVTMVERAGRLLATEDADAAGLVRDALARDGVTMVFNAAVTRVRSSGNDQIVTVAKEGAETDHAADLILIASGRVPNVDGLGLEAAGVRLGRNGVEVDDFLATANPAIFAAGDVCSSRRFTHVADAHARILLANALFPGRQRVSRLTVPTCLYTDPEIARVGIEEHTVASSPDRIHTVTVPLGDVDRAVIDGETEGFARVHLRKGTDAILGATIVSRHAGDMINEITLAMNAGIGLSTIGKTIHPYPSQGEAVRKLADAYTRTRLTPLVKRITTAWLSWTR